MRDLNELLPQKDIEDAASEYAPSFQSWMGFCDGAKWASEIIFKILQEEFREELKDLEYEILDRNWDE